MKFESNWKSDRCKITSDSAYLWRKIFETRITFFASQKKHVSVAISQKVPVRISPHFQGF